MSQADARLSPRNRRFGLNGQCEDEMRHLSIGVTVIATLTAIGRVWAQGLPYSPPQPLPPAVYSASRLPAPGLAPEDAYRDGLINRWELEQYAGPVPQALQGPAVNGNKGMQTGGGM